MPRIDRIDDPTPRERKAIVAPLHAFTRSRGFDWRPRSLTLALLDDSGAIVGGLSGHLCWEWLYIDLLGVAEAHRGQGWGRSLVERAESVAAEEGCHHAWLDTFSFQSRPFYEHLGYRVFGELADYPTGQTRYFLARPLSTPGGRTRTGSDPANRGACDGGADVPS